ncbi:gliding motility-associated C-terminal domain-containing protein [Lacinutrix mariniflava]|uniref:T9SS type B sorting domain-containing protein n=1 Tax=Lacinutrix mariniflava TaxID=342955 RepID=UPI0006E3E2CE|nr:gliding motility-associated C-terminal domain-containing protein [Lacinutrix mariniflava]
MKKITLLLAIATILFGLNVNAQITTYPYSEDFEAGDGGWIADNATSGTWALGTPASVVINSAASGANSWVTNLTGNYNNSESSTVTSPVFDLSSLAAPAISLSLWWESEFSWDGTVLQSSIDGGTTWVNVGALGDGGNWYNDGSINGNPGGQQIGWTGRNGSGSNGWVTANHALTGLAGEASVILRIAFASDGSGVDDGVAFDDISVFEVTCAAPSNLSLVSVSSSTVDLLWVAGGTETTWEAIVQTAGTGLPTGSGVAVNTTPGYQDATLAPVTDYEFYVRSSCGGDFSIWSGPFNFTTECAAFIPDYIEDFATIPADCWDEADSGDAISGPGDIGAGSWNQDGFLNNGFNGAYSINLWLASKSDWLLSPSFDLTGGPFQAEFDLGVMAFGSSVNPGTLGSDDIVQILISTDLGVTWTILETWDSTTVFPVTGLHPVYDLTAYSGQNVQFGILGSEGTVNDPVDNEAFVDNFQVRAIPNCPDVANLAFDSSTATSANISWDAFGGETGWEVSVQAPGTGIPTAAGTATTNNAPYVAMGLTSATDYEAYVRTVCGSEFGTWIGPVNFATECTTFIAPYTEGFENGGDIPLCWTMDGGEDWEFADDGGFDHIGNNGTLTGTTATNNYFAWVDSSGDDGPSTLTTPLIDVSALVAPTLSFYIISDNEGNDNSTLDVEVWDGTAWIPMGTYNTNTNGWEEVFIDLSGLTITGDVQANFIFSETSTGFYDDIAIDDVTFDEAPTCFNPVATYQIIDDCANGDQFFVDVDVTYFGGATSVSVEDNQGGTLVSVSATTGVTQFGPYPFNTDIIFTVTSEQDTCFSTSPSISLAACPPANDNCSNATVALVNDSFLCEVSTPGTLQEATPSGVPNPSCGGNPDDDVWFQFVATSEFHYIALANIQGSLTFNIDHAVYEGACDALTEISCTSGFDLLSSVTPQLIIGDTYFVRIFSNASNEETTTFDLCISPYEAPANVTCDLTENLCPGGDDLYSYNTINVLPGFGAIDCLGTSPNPTFSILEIGTSGDIEIEMVQNTAFDILGTPIGQELDVDFAIWGPFNSGDDFCNGGDYPTGIPVGCSYSGAAVENFVLNGASAGDLYILLITNFDQDPGIIQINQTNLDPTNPDPNAGTLSGEITVDIVSADATFIDDDNDDATPSIANLCGFDSILLEADSPFADAFEWYVNGILDPALTGSSITVTESNSYAVTAYDNQCMGNATTTVIVNLFQEAIVSSVPQDEVSITTCDDESGDGIEDFNLEGLSSIILNTAGQDAADFLVTYHSGLNDAQTGANALVSPYSAADGTIIFVRVEDVNSVGTGSGCASTNTTFELVVLGALPEITQLDDLELCDDESRDGTEDFDLEQHTPTILNGQDPAVFVVTYHASQIDADAGVNALISPYSNTSSTQMIVARIQNNEASDCYKTTEFNIIVKDIPVTTFDANIDYAVCPNANAPITLTAIADNYTESDVTIEWLYEGVTIAGQTDLTLDTVLLPGDYEILVTFNGTSPQCTSTQSVTVEELESCVIPQGISPNGDGLNETFDLSSFDVQVLTIFNRNGVKVYEKTNYLNEWYGQSLDGDELPTGTYYYVMNYQGNKTKAAWVYINRENK